MIQINKRYGIRRSKMCVSICKSFMVKGNKEWRDMWFFTDVPAALEKFIDMAVLRGLDKGSWTDVINEVKAARAEITAIKEILKG